MLSASAYVESGAGSQVFWWVAWVLLVAAAAWAKRLADRRGRNGWVYFFVTLLCLPLGVVLTAWTVLRGRARMSAG